MKWLFLLALPLCAQSVQIDCGSPSDQYFSGGIAWNQASLGQDTTLRYGKSFSYSIPTAPGLYWVKLTLIEPNATGPGQRTMIVSVNGQATDPIDIWAIAKITTPYVLKLPAAMITGKLNVQLTGIVGNAVVSSITVEPGSNPNVTFQAPMTFGPRCERDGEHQFNLGPDNILCICKIKQPNPVWLCSPIALVEK
jgi:hypothetical protein